MADTTSSDTTSEYPDDNLSDTDISAERQARFVVVGQRNTSCGSNSGRHFLKKLFTREIRGCLSQHNYFPEERLFTKVPSWGHLPLTHVIPMSALQAGHIVMGLTQCGQFLLTYTCSMDLRVYGSLYKYLLHWWAFSPTRFARKVAEVTLFGSYTISKELDVVVAQWPMERNKIVIHGLHADWGNSQTTDRAYLTVTTLPSLSNCRECAKVAASYEEEELAANWDGCVRCNCLLHGLTVHTTYEVISPYPRFRASVCLNYQNHVVVNTGNFLHVLRVDLFVPKRKNIRNNSSDMSDMVPLETSDVDDLDDTRTECYNNSSDKLYTLESSEASPVSAYTEDLNKSCDCANTNDCECGKNSSNSVYEQKPISVRDKILQDFCDDVNQELSIGSDSITLVKHASCSPRSTPQRLPVDSRQCQILMPPSDILRTRTESSHSNTRKRPVSPQPGTSQDPTITVTSINSPLHILSISPVPCSPRLMSPPIITASFRHPSPRKRSSLHSPPPRTRATHKLTLEAEKAYEFTDDTQETCEKLSSFRKRRLADKKYEFRVEAEDTENIIPFKHIRDQNEHRYCSAHRYTSRESSPAYSGNKKIQHDDSETEDNGSLEAFHGSFKPIESGKTVLQPLSLNQRMYNIMFCRDRYMTVMHNDSPLAPRAFIPQPTIKCTTHFKRSYIELDDEMISVITDVEDDETGGYVSYQCVLPMHVHGSGYVQMQMISNGKAERMALPHVSINQFSFDIETFSHHIADWICRRFKKKYWHCSDYDIEIIDVCSITGDVICLLIMKIQASEYCKQPNCLQERKMYEAGCKYIWNIDTNQYKITHILPMTEKSGKNGGMELSTTPSPLWNPTRYLVPLLRKRSNQHYARPVRFLEHSMSFSTDSLVQILDRDNLVSLYMTAIPDETGPD
ncbi:uncharacterized protein LOC135165251 isoform X1 [Diachasmimorpha longicaudata]|uniref:uncharacterized protein LOC135165251 isoform X1 n=1 Tax=Diachasmimorpha longicaudata TaxID=58733 RepID=UPI0030B87C71